MSEPSQTSPPPPSGPRPGGLLAGRYRLDRILASGGMAQVWKATDEVLQRPVAVKILHAHLAEDATFGARFRQEAIAAARLAHPSIVAIYDTCRDGDTDAIVMELVEGDTLRAVLDDQGVLPADDAVRITVQILDALDEAHRQGMVHRDIKPANVLVQPDGRAKVADFGIAKLEESSDLTGDGMMVGTAKYLAPEQVRSEPVDARADLYSVGVVLYEMLCGRPPFDGETAAETALARLSTDPPRPRQLMTTVPPTLESVVVRAMAREPEERFQFASDFRAALLHPQSTGDATVIEPSEADLAGFVDEQASFVRRERNWLVPTFLVVLVATALGLAGVLFGRTDAGRDLIDRVTGSANGGSAAAPLDQAAWSADDFDPFGNDQEENADEAPLAIDGDENTVWSTESYEQSDITLLKPGVGISVQLGDVRQLEQIELVSPTNGWAFELYLADGPQPTLEAWGEPVAAESAVGRGTVTIENLDGRSAGAVLLWITNRGDAPGRAPFELAELRATGS